MGKARRYDPQRFARFAIEDFGTTEVPVALRRRARLEADRLGITPKEALDRIRAGKASGTDRLQMPRATSHTTRAGPGRALTSGRQATGRSEPPRGARATTASESKHSIQELQRNASAKGRKWVRATCTACPGEVLVHVEWQNPLVMCKKCRVRRRARLRRARGRSYAAKALRPRMPTEGWPVGGGLPGLGKRR
jgi:hypothetical protein